MLADNKMIWNAGEKAPVGSYICASCQDEKSIVFIEKDETKLKTCPLCGQPLWAKF